MLALVGSALNITTPSPLTKRREYEAFMRGPVGAVTHAFGSRDHYRMGVQHLKGLAVFPTPSDSFVDDFGIVESGQATVSLGDLGTFWGAAANNLLANPNDFSLWAQSGLGTETQNLISPAGHLQGWTLEDTDEAATTYWQQTATVVAGLMYVFHGLIRKKSGFDVMSHVEIAISPAAAIFYEFAINAATGQIIQWATAPDFYSIEEERPGGDWWYVVIGITIPAGKNSAAVNLFPAINPIGDASVIAATTGSTGFWFWQAQPGRFPTRPIVKLLDWRSLQVDLDLVTRIYREDGSAVELINERRAVVKKVSRKQNVLTLEVADVDRTALDQLFPIKTFTTANWAELYVDHVGRPIPQGVGTILKVPLTYVVKTGGTYKFAACEVIGTTPTLLTVYRDGRIVSSTEYTTATQTVSGTTYLLVNFTREQLDGSGRLYELSADISFPGSRIAADELKRVLQALGVTVDDDSFRIAAQYHTEQGIRLDAGYVSQRRGDAIVADLLLACRGQLRKTPAGAYALFVDRPRDVRLALHDQTDECEIEGYEYPEIAKTVRLWYRPREGNSESEGDLLGKLERTTTGATGEKRYVCPYIRDHDVADRLMSYLTKREQNKAIATATLHGVQREAGDVVAIDAPVTWSGTKRFAVPEISRPADANRIKLVEYVEDVFVYTAGTLPADATNTYSPDYSQTPPAAPTGLTVVSQGTSSDTDGKTTAYALIRATPPSVNWQKLMIHVTDTTTNEIHQAQLLLVSGNYEARIAGLRPNRAHTVIAWAVNSTNVDGATTAAVNFTSANYTTQPSAPTGVAVEQVQSKQTNLTWNKVSPNSSTSPPIDLYRIFRKAGAGSYSQVAEIAASGAATWLHNNVSHGTTYYYKIRAVDRNGNESNDSSEVSATPTAMINDGYIVGQGVSGTSIANSSINQGRTSASAQSQSGTVTAGNVVSVGGGASSDYSFAPGLTVGTSGSVLGTIALQLTPSSTQFSYYLKNNDTSTQDYDADWRQVSS